MLRHGLALWINSSERRQTEPMRMWSFLVLLRKAYLREPPIMSHKTELPPRQVQRCFDLRVQGLFRRSWRARLQVTVSGDIACFSGSSLRS